MIRKHKTKIIAALIIVISFTLVFFQREEKSEYKIQYKEEIESTLGIGLIWNRGDDIKSSKIFYQLDNVSVENEVDWLQLAHFHAEWSKKFYDVFVPYLI